jgi:hypothetical protein
MTKSQQYFHDMMEYNKDVFDAFKEIHEKYNPDTKDYQEELNEKGEQVMVVIRKYENLLCAHSESGKYGKFSNKTADTFWSYIRKAFPKIDFVGIK